MKTKNLFGALALFIGLGMTAQTSTVLNALVLNPGFQNVVVGKNAAAAAITNNDTGNSVYVGVDAGHTATGSGVSQNTFVGFEAGFGNDNGVLNTYIGADAGGNYEYGRYNVFLGAYAGYGSNVRPSGIETNNTFIGGRSGFGITTGFENSFVGFEAGLTGGTGSYNAFFGNHAGYANQGEGNAFIGSGSGITNTGNGNAFLGADSGTKNTGSSNVFVGYQSGNGISTWSGGGNVFLGFQSGFYETGSNKLYISNSATTTPLIHGDFNAGNLTFNASNSSSSRVSVVSNAAGKSGFRLTNLQGTSPAVTEISSFFPAVDYTNGDIVLKHAKNIGNSDLYIEPSTTSNNLRTFSLDENDFIFYSAYDDYGKVYIGMYPPGFATDLLSPNYNSNYKLFVEGGILTEKVKVALLTGGNWSDYVFEDNYKPMPLNEVESFIKKFSHLPGIESAQELVDCGLDLGAMQSKQMGKIEELTLYAIEQEKKLEQQGKEIEELKAQMKVLLQKK